ncbi:hypothetical protein GJ496_011423 [Pomphorhynchus laevis]|nr:hypothetical protein GJ496_011423 [Pomphorhynchus laevis]
MIFKKLVPEIIGIPNIDMELRSIICLPLRLGWMGVSDPSTESKSEFDRSQRLVSPIINANESISQKSIPMEIDKENNNMQKLQILTESISPTLQNSIKHACLKGASSWLSTLPIEQKGFHLSKRVFQDAIAGLRERPAYILIHGDPPGAIEFAVTNPQQSSYLNKSSTKATYVAEQYAIHVKERKYQHIMEENCYIFTPVESIDKQQSDMMRIRLRHKILVKTCFGYGHQIGIALGSNFNELFNFVSQTLRTKVQHSNVHHILINSGNSIDGLRRILGLLYNLP